LHIPDPTVIGIKSNNTSRTQNRRQKVFNMAALRLCRLTWQSESLIKQKLHWSIVFHFSIWGSLELCLGG